MRETDRKISLLNRLRKGFSDYRHPAFIHELGELLARRIYGLALGYEDLNDHEELRRDPLLALIAGKRKMQEPLAGKSTSNRRGPNSGNRPRTVYRECGLLGRVTNTNER